MSQHLFLVGSWQEATMRRIHVSYLRHRTKPRLRIRIAAVLLLTSCADEPRRAAPVSTDSAGITIVTSAAPGRTVSSLIDGATLIAAFGEDPQPYPLQNVSEAIRLSDGRIVFVDSRAREVAAFTPSEGVRTVAQQGNGPGEVALPANLQRLRADSFQVYDRRLSRVSVFAPEGTLAYEIQINAPQARPPSSLWRVTDTLLIGLLSDYSLRREIARSTDIGTLGLTPAVAALFNLNGIILDTAAVLNGYADIQTPGSSLAPAFGLSTPFAVGENGLLAFGSGDQPSVMIATATGNIERIHRLQLARTPVSREPLIATLSADQAVARQLGAMANDNPVLAPEFLPDSQPAYKDLRVYNEQIWLGSADPFLIPSRVWNVIAPDGSWVAAIGLPADAHLLDVDGEFVTLRRTGGLDVQRVEVYRLQTSIGA
jgi:hypothetical protein